MLVWKMPSGFSQGRCPSEYQWETLVGCCCRGILFMCNGTAIFSHFVLSGKIVTKPSTPIRRNLLFPLAHRINGSRCFHWFSSGLRGGFACSALLSVAHRILAVSNWLIQSSSGHVRFPVLLHATLWLTV